MARPRLRRWHVDVAFFLGLTLFVCCYWYHTPAPLWIARLSTDAKIKMNVSALGFSADGQSYFTIKDSSVFLTDKPTIQGWNTLTGELQAEYHLQVPTEEVNQFQPNRGNHFYHGTRTAKVPDVDVFYTVKDSISSPSSLQHYYDLHTGKRINEGALSRFSDFWYLQKNPVDDHHWGCSRRSATLHIYDLTTCTTIHTFHGDLNRNAYVTLLSPDGHYLFFVQESRVIAWSAATGDTVSFPELPEYVSEVVAVPKAGT